MMTIQPSEDLESVVIGFKLTSEPLSWVDIPVSIGSNSDEVGLADNVVRIEKEIGMIFL